MNFSYVFGCEIRYYFSRIQINARIHSIATITIKPTKLFCDIWDGKHKIQRECNV